MKRIFSSMLPMLALFVLASITVWVALAASPHYKKAPQCVDNGITVTCTGSISGLGNGDIKVTVAFTNADGSTGTTTCTNNGGNQAPGQNPAVPVSASGSALITNPKNGTATFTVTTNPPANPTAQVAGCPSATWTAAIDNVTFHGGTLTVSQEDVQGSGNFILITSLTISPLFP
jgi:hypothetical protein